MSIIRKIDIEMYVLFAYFSYCEIIRTFERPLHVKWTLKCTYNLRILVCKIRRSYLCPLYVKCTLICTYYVRIILRT